MGQRRNVPESAPRVLGLFRLSRDSVLLKQFSTHKRTTFEKADELAERLGEPSDFKFDKWRNTALNMDEEELKSVHITSYSYLKSFIKKDS